MIQIVLDASFSPLRHLQPQDAENVEMVRLLLMVLANGQELKDVVFMMTLMGLVKHAELDIGSILTSTANLVTI